MKPSSFLFLGIFILLAHSTFGQSWTLPRDEDGWSILTPSNDSRIIYVSSTDGSDATAQTYTTAQVGNDPRHPAIAVSPYKTLAAALGKMRDTYPDWILLKTGDSFPSQTISLHSVGIGRNASERMVMTYYGDSPQRPILKDPDFRSWRTGLVPGHGGFHHWAIVGIEFYEATADPNSPEYNPANTHTPGAPRFLAGGKNLLFEDCKFHFTELVIQADDAVRWENVEIRRNMLMNAYYASSCADRDQRPSATYLSYITNYLIEENLVDYAGWNPDLPNASKNKLNHGLYIQYTNDGELYVRGNIIARSSGNALQARSGGVVAQNLVIQSPAGLFVAHDTPHGFGADAGLTAVRQNVILEGHWMGDCPQSSKANFGMPLHETLKSGTKIEENIIAHNLDKLGTLMAMEQRTQVDYINNIIHDWAPAEDMTDPGWLNPDRSVGSYHASIGGTATTDAFVDTCRERAVGSWPYVYSAYAVIDYIREGFNLAPVGPGGGDPVPVTGIAVNPSTLNLSVNGNATLTAEVSPADATNKFVNWSSDNTDVAIVSPSGKVTGVAGGSATITGATSDQGFTDTVSVMVSGSTILPVGVTVSPGALSLDEGTSETLIAEVMPANATDRSVSWSSSNPLVATVDATGRVTAVNAGVATITATTNAGENHTGTASVSVTSSTTTGVIVEPAAITLGVDDQFALTARVPRSGVFVMDGNYTNGSAGSGAYTAFETAAFAPAPGGSNGHDLKNAFDPIYNVAISNDVEVGSLLLGMRRDDFVSFAVTLNVYANSNVTANDFSGQGELLYTENLTIPAGPAANGAVATTIQIDLASPLSLKANTGTKGYSFQLDVAQTFQLDFRNQTATAGGRGDYTTLSTYIRNGSGYTTNGVSAQQFALVALPSANEAVTWASSNPAVATVDGSGVVLGVGNGVAIITATTKDGAHSDTVEVTVGDVETFASVIGATLTDAETHSYESAWFGSFREDIQWNGWAVHDDLGWINTTRVTDSEQIWVWSIDLRSWVFVAKTSFPWVWAQGSVIWPDQQSFGWMYCFAPDPGGVWFYHAGRREWGSISR